MTKKKTRLIVRRGKDNVVLKIEDIVFAYREEAIVVVVDKAERKFLYDKSLVRLAEELDPALFFRANRRYLLNIHYIKSYKSFEKVKLAVSVSFSNSHHNVIVSQETAPQFRKWLSEEN